MMIKISLKTKQTDYIFVSHDIMPRIDISHKYPVILLVLSFSTIKWGTGFWKFNANLLHDIHYILYKQMVKNVILEITTEYLIPNDGKQSVFCDKRPKYTSTQHENNK